VRPGGGVISGKPLAGEDFEGLSYPGDRAFAGLDRISGGATVGHIHHIPTVWTGFLGLGATVLGRCLQDTGPAALPGVVTARRGTAGLPWSRRLPPPVSSQGSRDMCKHLD
jgi:hypothetical protein